MTLITISENMGAGGLEVARKVAAELDIDLFDDDRLHQEAKNEGLQSEGLPILEEKTPAFWGRILSRKPQVYLELMENVIYNVAQKGQGVIIGHGSQLLLRDFDCALHIFITASLVTRVDRLSEKLKMNHDDVEKIVKNKDREKENFFRYAFRSDWKDISVYDIIINTEKIGYNIAKDIIIESLKSYTLQSCSVNAIKKMKRYLLRTRVESEILNTNIKSISQLHVDVPEDGLVYLTGFVYSENEKTSLLDKVRSVSDVLEIEYKVMIVKNYFTD